MKIFYSEKNVRFESKSRRLMRVFRVELTIFRTNNVDFTKILVQNDEKQENRGLPPVLMKKERDGKKLFIEMFSNMLFIFLINVIHSSHGDLMINIVGFSLPLYWNYRSKLAYWEIQEQLTRQIPNGIYRISPKLKPNSCLDLQITNQWSRIFFNEEKCDNLTQKWNITSLNDGTYRLSP